MESVSVAQARERFAEVLGQAASGSVEITRHGHPVAYIVGPDMFRRLTQPDQSHLFASEYVTPAELSIEQLLDLEPIPLEGGQGISEVLDQLREDRV